MSFHKELQSRSLPVLNIGSIVILLTAAVWLMKMEAG